MYIIIINLFVKNIYVHISIKRVLVSRTGSLSSRFPPHLWNIVLDFLSQSEWNRVKSMNGCNAGWYIARCPLNKACTPALRAHPIKIKDNNTGMSDAFLESVFYPTSSEQSTCTTKVTWEIEVCLATLKNALSVFYSYRWFHLDCCQLLLMCILRFRCTSGYFEKKVWTWWVNRMFCNFSPPHAFAVMRNIFTTLME